MLRVVCRMNTMGSPEMRWLCELREKLGEGRLVVGIGGRLDGADHAELRSQVAVTEDCGSLGELLLHDELFSEDDMILPVFFGEQFAMPDPALAEEWIGEEPGYVIAHDNKEKTIRIDLLENPEKLGKLDGFCAVKYSALKDIWTDDLNTACPDELRVFLQAELAFKNSAIRVITTPAAIQTEKGCPEQDAWYGETFFARYEKLGERYEQAFGQVPYYVQYVMGYQLLRRFIANTGKKCSNRKMWEEDYRNGFFRNCERILKYVDSRILMRLDGTELMRCPEPVMALLFSLKQGKADGMATFVPLQDAGEMYCTIGGCIITCVSRKRMTVEKVSNAAEGCAGFTVSTNGVFEAMGCSFQAVVNDRPVELSAGDGDAVQVFGKTLFHKKKYEFKVEKKNLKTGNGISFYYAYGNLRYPLIVEKIKSKFEYNVLAEKNSNVIRFAPALPRKTDVSRDMSGSGFDRLVASFRTALTGGASMLVGLSAEAGSVALERKLAALTASKLYRSGKMVVAVFTGGVRELENTPAGRIKNVKILDRKMLRSLDAIKDLLRQTGCDCFMWDSDAGYMTEGFYSDAAVFMAKTRVNTLVPVNTRQETFKPAENVIADLLANPHCVPTDCRGAVYSAALLEGITQEDWDVICGIEFEDERLLAAFCLLTREHPVFACFAGHAFILETAAAEDGTAYRCAMDEKWYFPSVEKFFLATASRYQGSLPIHVQYALLYRLMFRLAFNENQKDTHVITEENLPQWKAALCRVLQRISDELIVDTNHISKFHTKPHVALWLLGVKHGDAFASSISYNARNLFINACGRKLLTAEGQAVQIEVLDYDRDSLIMECSTPGFFEVHNIMPHAEVDGTELVCENSYYFGHRKLFGENFWKRHTFRIRIPFAMLQESRLEFYYFVDGYRYPLKIGAKRFPAKLNDTVPGSYCRCKDHLLSFGKKRASIRISPYSDEKHMELETKLQEACLKNAAEEERENVAYLMNLRNRFYATREEFEGRNIWITFDKLYKAGDNGEYFMRRVREQKDGVEIHYIINEGYPDAERLIREGIQPLFFMSEAHILHFLNSRVIAATHANIPTFSGVPTKDFKYLQDLLKAEIVCIQHGLAVQWMPHNLYAAYDNLKRFYCASESELNNLGHPQYGYGEGALKLTGLARYDGLVSRSKWQILISPTWRSYIAMPSVAGNARPYSDTFKNTTYYKVFNGLIRNQKLAETAARCGYHVVYLLHPTLSSQVEDFEPAPGIEVRSPIGASYEDMMTESDLMVTDFSGIQFDFAYMRKPIVYYHPTELPAGYGEGGFNYREQGFGPICIDEETLVSELCGYMERECRLDEFYAARQNKFFAYDDHDNCLRIYQDLLEFDRKQQSDEREYKSFGFDEVPVLKACGQSDAGRGVICWEGCPGGSGYEILVCADQYGSYQLLGVCDNTQRDYPVPAEYQNCWFKVRALFCDGDIKGNCSKAVRAG